MDSNYLSLLFAGEYPQNSAVYEPQAAVTKPEPCGFGLPELRSFEHLYCNPDHAPKRLKMTSKKSRPNMSEKYRSLQKLLPNDRKMDIGTMLEEASKYVKFLQAQIRVLHSMPLVDQTVYVSGGGDGGLERLSRGQLLEVVLDSDVAQKVLYSRGWCVYSAEQLEMLQRIVALRSSASGQFVSYN